MSAKVAADDRGEALRQVRGDALCARITEVIKEFAVVASTDRKPYVYNASAVARRVPTTRRTLAKYEATVAAVLKELAAPRRELNGQATVDSLRDQVARLQEQLADRDRLVAGLRRHHLEIYSRLRANSIEGEVLIRPILAAEAKTEGLCPVCQRVFPDCQ